MMFWKKKPQAATDLSWLGTDMHAHLAPGIDDGSPDPATSLALIKGMEDLGYRKWITTPHVLGEMYPNTPQTIGAALSRVHEEAAKENKILPLHGAAEYFIDDAFQALLQTKAPLLTLSGNLVLVEFSMVSAPLDLQDILFQLQMRNYQPVIAHPERYIYLQGKKPFFDNLRDSGCLFQLNLLSLVGHYGNTVQELAHYFIKKGYYDFAGTDLHGHRHLEGLRKLGNATELLKLRDAGTLRNAEL